MKKLAYLLFWTGLATAGVLLERMGVCLIFLMLAAFSVSWLVETWHNHKFNLKLARMAQEVKERGNEQ